MCKQERHLVQVWNTRYKIINCCKRGHCFLVFQRCKCMLHLLVNIIVIILLVHIFQPARSVLPQKCGGLALNSTPSSLLSNYSLYNVCPQLNWYLVKVFVSESVKKSASCMTKTFNLRCFQFSQTKQSQMLVHVAMTCTSIWPEQGCVIWTKFQKEACFSSKSSGEMRGRSQKKRKKDMSPGMHFNSLNCPIFPCSFCFDDGDALHIFMLQAQRMCTGGGPAYVCVCVCVDMCFYLPASGYCILLHWMGRGRLWRH